jgi:uncharacterized SAM-binding protein YcdF (DUF218 family)
MTRRARLYTEMVTTGAVIFGDRARLLGFDAGEHPVAVQLGGSEPAKLAEAAKICVDLGYDALDTVGNAREARRWMAAHELRGPLIIVTSNYHMPRALVEMARAMPGMGFLPVPVISERWRDATLWRDPAFARLLAVEYVKFLAARTRSLLEGAFSSGSA